MLIRTADPVELPLTLDEAKDHLRVTGTADDADIAAKLRSAVSQLDGAEGLLNRALITQTWAMKLDAFPHCGFDIPLPPLQSVTSISYVDGDGVTQTLATSVYRVLNAGAPMHKGRVELAYGQCWPTTRCQSQAVTVTFVAGYGARNDVPEHIRHLILIMVKEAYDHRTPVDAGAMMRSPAYEGLFNLARFPAVG